VVPTQVWNEKILIGQFAGRRIVNTALRREYGDSSIPARRVEWLSEIDERKISGELSSSLRHQHPFSLIERSLYNEIFSIAYHNFFSPESFSSLLLNNNAEFLDSDSAFIGLISNISAYANYLSDRAELVAAQPVVHDILNLFFEGVPIDYSCAQSSDIHSAGFTRLISSKATAITTAAVLAILCGLAIYSSQDSIANDAQNVMVTNSLAAADDICTPKVSESAAIVLRSIGFDDLWKACQRAKAMQDRTGLDTGVRAADRPPAARPR